MFLMTMIELSNNNAILGNHSIDDLKQIISAIYEEAVKCKRSYFMLPSRTGEKIILTNALNEYMNG